MLGRGSVALLQAAIEPHPGDQSDELLIRLIEIYETRPPRVLQTLNSKFF
jgi:hypothetical protein